MPQAGPSSGTRKEPPRQTPAPVCEAWGRGTLLTHGASWPLPGQKPLLRVTPAGPSGSRDPCDAIPLLLPRLGLGPPP